MSTQDLLELEQLPENPYPLLYSSLIQSLKVGGDSDLTLLGIPDRLKRAGVVVETVSLPACIGAPEKAALACLDECVWGLPATLCRAPASAVLRRALGSALNTEEKYERAYKMTVARALSGTCIAVDPKFVDVLPTDIEVIEECFFCFDPTRAPKGDKVG